MMVAPPEMARWVSQRMVSLLNKIKQLPDCGSKSALILWALQLSILLCAADSFAITVTRKHPTISAHGNISVVYVDTFSNKDRQFTYLTGAGRHKKIVHITGTSPKLRSGDVVTLRAIKLRNNALVVRAKHGLSIKSVATTSSLVGSHKIALIRIRALDGEPSCSSSLLINHMWTGARSINGLYQASSFGQFSFAQDSNSDGQPDVFQVNINQNTLGRCNQYSAIASAADSALIASGTDLSSYDHRVYILPTNVRYSQLDLNGNPVPSSELTTQCYWAGMATVGGVHSWIPGEWCGVTDDSIDVITHEIGHNLGLNHARSDTNQDGVADSPDGEYSDLSCPMGRANRNYRHFNAVHKLQLGWISATTDITNSGTYTVSAVDGTFASSSAPHVLNMPTRLGTMYVSFRATSDSYNSAWQSSYYGKTSIHWASPTPGFSYLVATLGDGQSYRDPDTGTVISQISHLAGSAQVSISYGPRLAPAAPTGFSLY